MGYYIEVPARTGKARLIADGEALVNTTRGWEQAPEYKAEIIPQPASLADVPDGKALICVVENPLFEGAGYCFDQGEFEAFLPGDTDHRPRTWVLMDKDAADLCSGYAARRA